MIFRTNVRRHIIHSPTPRPARGGTRGAYRREDLLKARSGLTDQALGTSVDPRAKSRSLPCGLPRLASLLSTLFPRVPSRLPSRANVRERKRSTLAEVSIEVHRNRACFGRRPPYPQKTGALEAAGPANPNQKGITGLLEKIAAPRPA
jgi:hypothetical protein